MRLRHAEDIDKASRRTVATLASLKRQAELDREDWVRRAKEGASAGGEEVRQDKLGSEVLGGGAENAWVLLEVFLAHSRWWGRGG